MDVLLFIHARFSKPVGLSYEYRYAITDAVAQEPTRVIFGYEPWDVSRKGLQIKFLAMAKRWCTCDDNWAAFLCETGYGGLIIIGCLRLCRY